MPIEYYLGDWFYNMGIVGLLRILKFNNVDESKYSIEDNRIVLDEQLLDDFAEYYFNYFFSVYDDTQRLVDLIKKVEGQITQNKMDKAIRNIINLENRLKNTYEKVLDKTNYKNEYKKIIKNLNEIEQSLQNNDLASLSNNSTLNDLIQFINNDDVKNNYIAYMIKNRGLNIFLGQASFLNSKVKIIHQKEFVEKMEKDYILPIKNKLNQNLHINKTDLTCSICGRIVNDKNKIFNNVTFAPLGLSLEKNYNRFWNYETAMPICEECLLLLSCTAAGSVVINKMIIVNEKPKFYNEYSFVNIDSDIDTLFNVNEMFKQRSNSNNPYKELMFDIVTRTQQKARWVLENIFFIEFNIKNNNGNTKEYKNIDLHYYNISEYKANFLLDNRTRNLLERIWPERFQLDILDDILADKNIIISTTNELRNFMQKKEGEIKADVGDPISCFNAVQLKHLLEGYRKGWNNVSTRIINEAFEYGRELNRYFTANDAENKINSIGYKMLNAVKVGDKDEFMDNLLRTCMSIQKPIPDIFLNVLSEQRADFEDIALAFVSGFIASEASTQITNNDQSNSNEEV